MGQFSPRIVRALLEGRRNQLAIGLFIGTFAYTMTVLREIDDRSSTMPGLSVLICYGLIVGSVAVLVLFVHHAGQALRVSGPDRSRGRCDPRRARAPAPIGAHQAEADDSRVIVSPESGNVVRLDEATLVELAKEADFRLELVPTVGDFVPSGSPLLRVEDGQLERRSDAAPVPSSSPSAHEDDPSYGLRKLVGIAAHSIASSPFDDPTTTVQALHRLHDRMRQLATKELPSGCHHDSEGDLRLVVPVLDWKAYVRLAFDEVRLVGAGSPQVAEPCARRSRTSRPSPARPRSPLDRQLELLTAAVERAARDPPAEPGRSQRQ